MDNVNNVLKNALSKIASAVKTHWKKIIVVLVLFALVIATITLGIAKYNDDKKIKDKNSEISSLNSNLNKANQNISDLDNKVNQISAALALTEEGKKQLESINTTLESDKSKLTEQNQDLTQKVSSVEAQLAAKQRELANTQANLNKKNAELAAATKCVNLFKTVQGQYDAFNANLDKGYNLINQAYDAYDRGDEAEGDRLWDLAIDAFDAADASYKAMEGNLNKFKSGQC